MTLEIPTVRLTRAELIHAYQRMRLIREFEDRVHLEFKSGRIPGFLHLYSGQEASAVGICSALSNQDCVTSTHRGHGHYLAKGGDLSALAAELYGKQDGCCGGKGGSMHVFDWRVGMLGANAIVGASVPHALGASLAAKLNDTGAVSVAFLGDGGSNQGTFMESLNLAKVLGLAVLFVVEDNGYAEATSSSWAVAGDLVKRAEGFGVPGERVDGSCFFEVNAASSTALTAIRSGSGPRLLHVKVPIFVGHFEGDAETYRPVGEVRRLRAEKDCLKIFRNHEDVLALLGKHELDEVDADVNGLIEQAFADAHASAPPAAEALFSNVYASY